MKPISPPTASVLRKALLLGIWLAAIPWLAAAEPPDVSGSVNLPQLIRLGGERNPQTAAARARWQASIEAIPQATALPDPMLRYDYFGASVETRVGPQRQRVMVSQPFPFPGTLSQAGELAGAEARVRHARYDQALRDMVVNIKLSYQELLYLRRATTLTEQNKALLKHLTELTSARYAEGSAKLADLLKAQSQFAQLSYDSLLLAELERTESARLAALLDLPDDTVFGELAAPPVPWVETPLAQLQQAALDGRQELAAAAAMVDKAEAGIGMARLQNRPKFSFDASYIDTDKARMGSPDDSGKDPWTIGFGITIPLWAGKNSSRLAEANARHDAALADERSMRADTRAAVSKLYFRLTNSRRLVELYDQTLIPQAAKAMELAEQQSDATNKDVSGLLETQSTWLNFNLARLRALTDYAQAVARLEQLVGGPLPKAGEATP